MLTVKYHLILFLTSTHGQELKFDLPAEIKRIASFIGAEVTEDEVSLFSRPVQDISLSLSLSLSLSISFLSEDKVIDLHAWIADTYAAVCVTLQPGLRRMTQPCGVPQVESTAAQSSFRRMRRDSRTNYSWLDSRRHDDRPAFMRKGIVGSLRLGACGLSSYSSTS